jgi:hypothetical protein
VYVEDKEAPLIVAQWKQRTRDTFVSDDIDARKIVGWLLEVKSSTNSALIGQIAKLNATLDELELEIRTAERELDDFVYQLYRLSDAERFMIESDTRARWDARMPMLSS